MQGETQLLAHGSAAGTRPDSGSAFSSHEQPAASHSGSTGSPLQSTEATKVVFGTSREGPAPSLQQLSPACGVQVMAEQPWAAQVNRDPSAGEERPLMLALDTSTGESQHRCCLHQALYTNRFTEQHLLLSKQLRAATDPSVKQHWVHLTSSFVQQLQLRLLLGAPQAQHTPLPAPALTGQHWYHQDRPSARPQGCKNSLQSQGAGK